MKKHLLVALVLSAGLYASSHNKVDIVPVDNALYLKECTSCHFAYQAGLLPSRSWEKVMSGLNEHFGTDASIPEDDKKRLLSYLVQNSADSTMATKRSQKINRSIDSMQTPIAITQVPYFIKEHRKIPKHLVAQKEVRSLANCSACHTTAQTGSYSERAIKIPNYGKWDD